MKVVNEPAYGGECLKYNNDSMCFIITHRGITLGQEWVANILGAKSSRPIYWSSLTDLKSG